MNKDPRQEVDEELRFHLEQRTRDYIARGMTPEAAREAAAQRFGDTARVREACTSVLVAERAAEERRTFVKVSWIDVKLGLRMFAQISRALARRRRRDGGRDRNRRRILRAHRHLPRLDRADRGGRSCCRHQEPAGLRRRRRPHRQARPARRHGPRLPPLARPGEIRRGAERLPRRQTEPDHRGRTHGGWAGSRR